MELQTRIQQALDQDGWQWQVLILAPGMGANKQYFPVDTLRQAVPLFDGARVFCLDEEQHSKSGDKSARQIVGWITQATYADGEGVKGTLTLLKNADWLRQNLLDSHQKGKPDLYGLSVDAPGKAQHKRIQESGANGPVKVITQILPPVTVDVVWSPGTPGGFQRVLNAHLTEEDSQMKEQLLKILQAKRPDLHKKIEDPAAVTEEQILALLEEAVPVKQAETTPTDKEKKPGEDRGKTEGLSDADRTVIRQAEKVAWNAEVRELIEGSKLPGAMQTSLRKRFMDTPGDLERVKQAITQEREVYDHLAKEGKVTGVGYAKETEVEGEAERLQQAMFKLFGIKGIKSDAPAFVGIRQAYVRITGDVELAGRSRDQARLDRLTQAMRIYQAEGMDKDLEQAEMGLVKETQFARIQQAQVAGAWPLILGNTLHRRLVQDYMEVDYGENRIISNRRRATDFRALEAMRLKYSADLSVVDPETDDYPEAAELGEEGVSYTISTRGRIMSVSRKTIINDDLGAVLRLPQREGRAARRTFARLVWNLFMSNATYDGDAVAWFHANHANIGSTALTADATGVAAVVAALNRLMAQTEPGSSEKLGGAWWAKNITLVVPNALQAIAKQLNQSNGIPGTSNEGDNPIYSLFGDPQKPERIFVNPLFTDATDWGLFRDPNEMDIIEVAFLNGQETPEVFVADQQTVGQMFLADKVQYKIRHEYGAELLDYRSADKSVVAG